MKNATRSKNLNVATSQFESLEDRRLMSKVSLADGMLILQGNANGNNRLTVSADPGGKTVYARANDVKKHYLLKDIQTIRVQGGEKNDVIDINKAIAKSSFIRGGNGSDSICGGSGSDTVFGENGNDSIKGGNGDDLLLGGSGSNKIDAGSGDNAGSIWQHKNARNKVAVTSFALINADTKAKIMDLKDGATLDLAKLPKHLNIVAVTSKGGKNGSVRFSYDALKPDHIENAAPFAMAGDKLGEFAPWLPATGQHTLTATPYSGKNSTGQMGTEKVITFNVINSKGGATPQEVNKNPTTNKPTDTGGGTTTNNNTNNNTNTGTNTGTGTGTDTNTDDGGGTTTDPSGGTVGQTPTATIKLMDSTIPVGMAAHVNGLSSTLKSGDVLGAKFEWNFGDTGSKYNTLTGFNAAHAYTKPGTYTITLKVTNAAGGWDTSTATVTVTAANRRFVYVSPNGNDANNGSSQDAAVKTFKRASQLVGDNTEVLFERGGTYTTSDAMSVGHDNVVVGAYGTGNKPVMKYTGGDDYGAIFSTLTGKDVLIHDVAFDSTNTGMGDQGYNDAVSVGGTNISVRDCTFVNVGYAINANGLPTGVLVQDNVAPNANSLRGYLAWIQGSDQVYLGNSCKDSLNVHTIRIGGADRILIANNDITNLKQTAERPSLSIHKGSYVYAVNNKLSEGDVSVGPLDAGAGLDDKGARIKYAVLENNVIKNATVQLLSGSEHIAVRNNVILKDNGVAINMKGWSDIYDRGNTDIYIVHNTVINTGSNGQFLHVGGPVNGVTLDNNLYVAPSLETGPYSAAPVDVDNGDLTGFRSISDNIWPQPTMHDGSGAGINIVGSYKTATQWEAYLQVDHDQFKDVTLSSSYMITLGGVTAGADMSK